MTYKYVKCRYPNRTMFLLDPTCYPVPEMGLRLFDFFLTYGVP